MQWELNQRRESHAMEVRKHDRDQLITQKRRKFMDLSDLLTETNTLADKSFKPDRKPIDDETRTASLIYGCHQNQNALVDEADDSLHAMMIRSDSNILGEKCKCISDLISLLNNNDYQIPNSSKWLAFRTAVNLILRAPKIDYELNAGLLQAIIGKLDQQTKLKQVECTALISCLEEIPAQKRTEIFIQHRRLLQFIVQILLKQIKAQIANRFIRYIDSIFSGCDEDSRDILQQNLNLIKGFVGSLLNSPQTTDSVLVALSNIALNGPEMVQFLNSVNLIPSLMTIFEHAKPRTKRLIVILFYNLVLSSNDQQIIYICQNGLMYLIDYCLVNPINLESLQLCLKILEKLVSFLVKRYVRSPNEVDPQAVLKNSIGGKLKNLTEHSDEFVRDIAAKIQEQLGCPSMEVETAIKK